MMKWCFSTICLLSLSLFSADFRIMQNNQGAAVFEQPSAGIKSLLFFNDTLKQMGKKPLAIVKQGKVPAGRNVIRFEVSKSGNLAVDDRFTIEFPASNVMLIHCTDISIQWAINHLLETAGTVRWLYPEKSGLSYLPFTEMKVPCKKYVSPIPSYNLRRYICNSNPSWYPKAGYKDTLDANHLLLKYVFPTVKYDRTFPKIGSGSFSPAFPSNTKYQKGWPQEIMPVIKGKRLKEPLRRTPNAYWQPCYTNPATARIAAENIIEYLNAYPTVRNISLIQNDCGGSCECANCVKVNHGDKYYNSESYFAWANAVAEKVCAKYPDVKLIVAGYTSSKEPPSFKLHKNIMVLLAMDFYSCSHPEIMKQKKAYIDAWSRKASTLGVWDYAWGHGYVLPRVYYHVHAEMLRYLYRKGGRIYFSENECMDVKEGPKAALVSRLIWDLNTDVDKFIAEWCSRAVGPKAGPVLRQYYDFWEKFMSGPAIRQTPWFQSAYISVYMTWDGDLSHMYAVSSKDLKTARDLMTRVVQLAGTPIEKERAKLLFRHYEYMETILKLYGAELLPPANLPENAQQAAAFVRDIQNIPALLKKRDALTKEFFADPVMGYYYSSPIYKRRIRFVQPAGEFVFARLKLILDHAGDPAVSAELKKLKGLPWLDKGSRQMITALATYLEQQNLFPNGNMETIPEAKKFWIHPGHRRPGNGVLSAEKVFKGKHAFKLLPMDYTLVRFLLPADPDTLYLFTFRLYVGGSKKDTDIRYTIYPARGENCQSWGMIAPRNFELGKWHNAIGFTRTRKDSDHVAGYLFFRDFAHGQAVYLDDFKLVKFK